MPKYSHKLESIEIKLKQLLKEINVGNPYIIKANNI